MNEPIKKETQKLGSQWDNLSIKLRRDYPLCLDPLGLHKNILRESKEVHHNIPRKLAPDLLLEQQNLIPLCRECHEALEKLTNKNLILSPWYIKDLKDTFNRMKRGDSDEGLNRPNVEPQEHNPTTLINTGTDGDDSSRINTGTQRYTHEGRINTSLEDDEEQPSKPHEYYDTGRGIRNPCIDAARKSVQRPFPRAFLEKEGVGYGAPTLKAIKAYNLDMI